MSSVLAPPQPTAAPVPAEGPAPGRRGLAAWLVRWRLALRMARRDARRAKGRTAIVLVMVGVPILAVVAGETLYRTNDVTAVESLPARLGAADVQLDGVARQQVYGDPLWGGALDGPADPGRPWTAEEVRELLPDGSRVVERQQGQLAYRTPIGYSVLQAFAEDTGDPMRQGAYQLVDGRLPRADGEIAISRPVAARGFAVGDRIEVTRDDVPMTVVGVVASDAQAGPLAVVDPEAADLLTGTRSDFFATVPGGLDWPAVRELNGKGVVAVSREVVEDPPPASAYYPPGWGVSEGLSAQEVAVVALIVTAVLLEVVLLAGPAFAVGLRRQRRVLALMAAGGGTPADLRRTVLASGLLLGASAAVLGGLLGIGLAAVAVPVAEADDWAQFGPFDVSVRDALVVVLVGALAGLAAAYVPARQAARTDVVTTLTGRRGQVRSSWRLPLLGLLLAAGGLVLSVMGAQGTELAVAGGAVLLVVGLVVATPWLVGLLVPLARRLPVAGRLAVRDATRNRARTAPAVAAVMATVAGVTTLAIATSSDSAQEKRDYVQQYPMGTAAVSIWNADDSGWAAAREAVGRYVPGRDISEVRLPSASGSMLNGYVMRPGSTGTAPDDVWYPEDESAFAPSAGQVAAVDSDALAALTDPALRDAAAAAYRSGRAVVFGAGAVDRTGEIAVQVTDYDGTAERLVRSVRLPAVEVPAPAGADLLRVPATVVLPPGLEDRLGVPFAPNQLLVGGPDQPVTAGEEQRLTEAVAALTPDAYVYVERGWQDRYWVVRLLLVVVGGLLVLVATLTATGLAVADARPDLGTLAAVGAAPRTRRLMAMGSAAVIGAFGAALGVLAGLAPGIAIAYPLTNADYGSGAQAVVVVPWAILGIVAVGVPLLAVVVTGLAVRSRLPMATRIAG